FYFAIVVALYGDHYSASIFGINPSNDIINLVYLIMNWAICIPIGILWWYLENFTIRIYHKKEKIYRK
ncbi:MAG: hypothetical protein ACFE9R_10035, partial [Candidatus Hermodarchaeota archaeon]